MKNISSLYTAHQLIKLWTHRGGFIFIFLSRTNFISSFYDKNGAILSYLYRRLISIFLKNIEHPALFTEQKVFMNQHTSKIWKQKKSIFIQRKIVFMLIDIIVQQLLAKTFSGFTSKVWLFIHTTLLLNMPITLYCHQCYRFFLCLWLCLNMKKHWTDWCLDQVCEL